MKFTCKNCGCNKNESDFFRHKFTKSGYRLSKCKQCDTDYQRTRSQSNRRILVEHAGGKCSICGYSACIEALEFHHSEQNKEADIAVAKRWSLERSLKEMEKCVLVCCLCHREIHAGLHGNIRSIGNKKQ